MVGSAEKERLAEDFRFYFFENGHFADCQKIFLRFSGFGPIAAARMFAKLMERLNFNEYYCQGGDWGSMITTALAQMYPQR